MIYDVDLTMTMPPELSATSGINAIAHAVEALYARDRNPVISLMAQEGIRTLAHALPIICAQPDDKTARTDALYGAWLSGICLGAVGMALHHKLCHTLGGSFNLPHAETHTVILPHALAYNAPAVPDAMARIATALGVRRRRARPPRSGAKACCAGIAARDRHARERHRPGRRPRREEPVLESAPDRARRNPRIDRTGLARRRSANQPRDPLKENIDMRNFDEATITDAVLQRVRAAKDDRIRQVSEALVRHLHAFVREIEPTQAEWETGIDFLTRTGQMCDDKRQEFILLSDTLGVSMLVDAINHRTPEGATETTVLGPFYVQRAPEHPLGADISGTMEGAPLLVTGTVSTAGGEPLAGAVVDVWHSDDDGYYDVQQLDEIGELAMRARFRTDENGRFWFWSIRPAAYPIPHDGPVGKMLEAQGRHPWRPAHVHFMISAPGHQTLVTHVFAAGDQYLDSDVVFGVKDSLIREFAVHACRNGRSMAARWRSLIII